jgi:hypothetical protein
MKFLPTEEQTTLAMAEHVKTIDLAGATELSALLEHESIIRLHNATIMEINRGGIPNRQWRLAMIIAMRTGWILREQANASEASISLEKLLGITEAEMVEIETEIRREQNNAVTDPGFKRWGIQGSTP